MSTYTDRLQSLLPVPLARLWGRAWAVAHGAELDGLLQLAKRAAKAGFVGIAPPDAMPYHGRDRGIPALAGETMEAYRARLVGAWDTWSWATTRIGLREAILLGGFGGPTLYTQEEFPRPPSGGLWARFTVVFTGRATWDLDAAWDEAPTTTWDGRRIAPIESMDLVVARRGLETLLTTWKSARDRVTSVLIAGGSHLWDIEGMVWDDDVSTWDEGDTPIELESECWDDHLDWDSAGPSGHGSYDFFL